MLCRGEDKGTNNECVSNQRAVDAIKSCRGNIAKDCLIRVVEDVEGKGLSSRVEYEMLMGESPGSVQLLVVGLVWLYCQKPFAAS